MFGDAAKMDLVRLAIPRRLYTDAHLSYVAETVFAAASLARSLCGYRIVRRRRCSGTSARPLKRSV